MARYPSTSRSAYQPDPVRVVVEHSDSLVLVHLGGEVDMSTVDQAAQPIRHQLAASPAALVLDLLDVTFFSAAGLRLLIEARSTAELAGIDLRVVAGRAVTRPMELTGIRDSFAVHAPCPKRSSPRPRSSPYQLW